MMSISDKVGRRIACLDKSEHGNRFSRMPLVIQISAWDEIIARVLR